MHARNEERVGALDGEPLPGSERRTLRGSLDTTVAAIDGKRMWKRRVAGDQWLG